MSPPTRILLADDHPLVASALSNLLARESGLDLVGHVRNFPELWTRLGEDEPDVLVLDIGMPGGSAVEAVQRMGKRHPQVRILILSGMPEEEFVARMIDAGADGYVQKEADPATLVEAVTRVSEGRIFLTESATAALARSVAGQGPDHEVLSDRELQVLRLLGQGSSVTEIASHLHLSPKTVSTYRRRLMEKMGFSTTADIIRYAVRRGLVE